MLGDTMYNAHTHTHALIVIYYSQFFGFTIAVVDYACWAVYLLKVQFEFRFPFYYPRDILIFIMFKNSICL